MRKPGRIELVEWTDLDRDSRTKAGDRRWSDDPNNPDNTLSTEEE
jgi:hypothetical protein